MNDLERVVQLLKNYQVNHQRVKRIDTDETIHEWKMDYRSRRRNGGLTSPGLSVRGEGGKACSIQERLLEEKDNILSKLERMKDDVELTKLLLLQLDGDDLLLIRLRYLDRNHVNQICSKMFISKSSFYRKHARIMNRLVHYYRKLKSS